MEKLPENWCIKITEENRDDVKSWFENKSGLCSLNEYGFSIGYYYSNVKGIIAGSNPSPELTKITYEQFKQNIMYKSKFTTITREQFKKGYNLACREWRKTLMDKFGKDLILNDTIDVEHSFVDKLRSVASNDEQIVFLKELFPIQNEINAQQLKIGEAMKVTDTLYKDVLLIRIYGGEFVNVLKPNQTWRENCSLNGIKVEFKVEIIEN